MSYTIRPAQTTESAALADLIRDIGYFAWVNDLSAEEMTEHVHAHLSLCLADASHSMYVACTIDEPSDILGYVSIHWLPYLISKAPEGYISELFVRPTAR